MIPFLRRAPLSVVLLPVFFVLHGFTQNLGYIRAADAATLAGFYILCSVIVFAVSLVWLRNPVKAALAACIVMGCNFFFGATQDFLKEHASPLSRYALLLPVVILLPTIVLIALRKTRRPLHRLNLFLNTLLLVYLAIDITGMFRTTGNDHAPKSVHSNVPFHACTACSRPDIYFLVFDAYQGSASLKSKYHFDNSRFDRFLQQQGFHIQWNSHANYKYTILSVPSILNMDYLDELSKVKGGPVQEYYYLSDRIRNNAFISILQSMQYEVVNCSIFDLAGNPSPITESLLPLKTRLITDQTLCSRCIRDIGWHVFQFTSDPLSHHTLYKDLDNNNTLLSSFDKAVTSHSAKPRFIYCHLNLPHPPYYFDRNGKSRTVRSLYRPEDEDNLNAYLDYLPYTNAIAEGMITKIKTATKGRAAIIFMGDHGLRYHDTLGFNPPWFVQNQNAVYLPGGGYGQLYDSISGVNQFRAVLNTLFKQDIPLLKDSVVNVKDKK